jgi:hypothetical protein
MQCSLTRNNDDLRSRGSAGIIGIGLRVTGGGGWGRGRGGTGGGGRGVEARVDSEEQQRHVDSKHVPGTKCHINTVGQGGDVYKVSHKYSGARGDALRH